MPTVRPPDGPIRFVTLPPFGGTTSTRGEATDAGLEMSFGLIPWDEGVGAYVRGDLAIRCYADGHFVAVWGAQSYSGTWGPP